VETKLAYLSQPSHGFRGLIPALKSWNWRLLFVLSVNLAGWLIIGKMVFAAF
jgi:hypothetical protein